MKQLFAPNGDRIVGTLESLSARANVVGWNHDGSPQWEGSTDVFWDGQRTVMREGQIVCLTESGEEFRFNECKLVDEHAYAEWLDAVSNAIKCGPIEYNTDLEREAFDLYRQDLGCDEAAKRLAT